MRHLRALDSGQWLRATAHLDRILDLPTEEWSAYLDQIRRDDPGSAPDVEAMLDEHRRLSAEGFLEDASPIQPIESTLAGVTIGAYRLESSIGHGGMGSVWRASRSDGRFEGVAAVKLLNAALVGRGGEERFKREGTILARLAHPHIARLIDAGVSDTGQAYLVLELIDGRHIDSYCDEERLSVEDRIRLFLDVQAAVSHAHANLVVHRDLKPSNVLVTTDGQVKLLDFGIAKLIEDDQDQLRLTREAGAAMTPKYAAPEQVTGGAITTATDVYSLGVLLYELLSGQHPAGDARSPSEYVKAVAETEPLRLSAAITRQTTVDAVTTVAVNRATTPDRLRRLLRGDLDTIIGKALKKDPSERYASVSEFADDLRRYADHQPISARPDALSYRAGKFIRRHWQVLGSIAAAVVVFLLLTGFYAVRLASERDRAQAAAAKSARVSELMTSLLISSDPFRTPDGKPPTYAGMLERGAERITNELDDQPELQAEMLTVIGRTFERMGDHTRSLPLLERALAIGRTTLGSENGRVAQSLNDLGVLQREAGNLAESERLLTESLAIRRRLLGSMDKDVAVTLVELARVFRDQGYVDRSEAPTREALAIRKQIFGEEHRETAVSKNDLARVLRERGDDDTAEALHREALATNERLLGPDHTNTGATKNLLATLLIIKGDLASAEALLRSYADIYRRAFGATNAEYGNALNNLAGAIELQGRLDEAERLLGEARRITEPQLGNENPNVLTIMVNQARVQIAHGHGAETEPALRHVLAARQRLLPSGHWQIGQAQSLLGAALMARQRSVEAEALMLAADAGLKPVPGAQDRERLANRARLVAFYQRSGRSKDAATFR